MEAAGGKREREEGERKRGVGRVWRGRRYLEEGWLSSGGGVGGVLAMEKMSGNGLARKIARWALVAWWA